MRAAECVLVRALLRAMRLLSALGRCRFRPRSARRAAIAAYMMALYRGSDDEGASTSWNSVTAPGDEWTDSGLMAADWLQLSHADIVVSFANQGPPITSVTMITRPRCSM